MGPYRPDRPWVSYSRSNPALKHYLHNSKMLIITNSQLIFHDAIKKLLLLLSIFHTFSILNLHQHKRHVGARLYSANTRQTLITETCSRPHPSPRHQDGKKDITWRVQNRQPTQCATVCLCMHLCMCARACTSDTSTNNHCNAYIKLRDWGGGKGPKALLPRLQSREERGAQCRTNRVE